MEIIANIADIGFARIKVKKDRIDAVEIIGRLDRTAPFVSPGFVDVQVNGFYGVDFSDPELTPEAVVSILPALWKTGVTSFCATLVTGTLSRLERNFRVLERARRIDARLASTMNCYHLEGPYISPGDAHGAHDPELVRLPDWKEFLRLQNAAGGNIGIVTVAPELRGALEFIRCANEAGVVIAIGHTDGQPSHIHKAIAAGAQLSTHLGNGCANVVHRHSNPLWAQIASNELSASLICDGFHLPRDLVRTIFMAKGAERCILVSDAVQVVTMPPGEYLLADTKIKLLPSGKVIRADGRSMAGSSLTMNRAVQVFRRFTGASLSQALRAATMNPARLLSPRSICGDIVPGQPANLIIFRVAVNSLRVESVLLNGEFVHRDLKGYRGLGVIPG